MRLEDLASRRRVHDNGFFSMMAFMIMLEMVFWYPTWAVRHLLVFSLSGCHSGAMEQHVRLAQVGAYAAPRVIDSFTSTEILTEW